MCPENGKGIALSCRNVSKYYGSRVILDAIDMQIAEGEVLGLLGPNGAGKTTLMKSILGLSCPDDGEIEVFGHDVVSKRTLALARVGAIVEAPMFPVYLTARDCLYYLSALSAKVSNKRIMEVLDLVGLAEAADRKVEGFSYGMKQRLGIAQALLPDSKFLILDEPANGLDPHGIAGMRRLLRRLSSEMKVSVLVSSHLLHEVEQVCGRVVIINKGKKILDATHDELASMDEAVAITVRSSYPEAMKTIPGFVSENPVEEKDFVVLKYAIPSDKVPDLVRQSVGIGADISSVEHGKSGLESIFISLTARRGDNDSSDSF